MRPWNRDGIDEKRARLVINEAAWSDAAVGGASQPLNACRYIALRIGGDAKERSQCWAFFAKFAEIS